jgi:hypothetical protein
MLQAKASGHPGSLATIPAETPRLALRRRCLWCRNAIREELENVTLQEALLRLRQSAPAAATPVFAQLERDVIVLRLPLSPHATTTTTPWRPKS